MHGAGYGSILAGSAWARGVGLTIPLLCGVAHTVLYSGSYSTEVGRAPGVMFPSGPWCRRAPQTLRCFLAKSHSKILLKQPKYTSNILQSYPNVIPKAAGGHPKGSPRRRTQPSQRRHPAKTPQNGNLKTVIGRPVMQCTDHI